MASCTPPSAPARTWFGLYAERFDTVEINNTFYRLPAASTVDGWAAQAPEGFCYAVKVGQFGSHRMKLRDASSGCPGTSSASSGSGRTSVPTSCSCRPGGSATPPASTRCWRWRPRHLRWAVELRDPTWLHDDVFEVLARHGAALCLHDLLADHPWERTASWTYVRFHGPRALEEKYRGRYTGRRLRRVAERLAAWRAEGTDVYAYFNNDYDGHAVVDALWLRNRLEALAVASEAREEVEDALGQERGRVGVVGRSDGSAKRCWSPGETRSPRP